MLFELRIFKNAFLSLSLILREEICTLSRQASFRRVNSVSTDARGQVYNITMSYNLWSLLNSLGMQSFCK